MKEISFFLEKFKTLGLDSALIKRAFVETVEKLLHVALKPSDVEVRGETVYVKAHPILKSELFIKREEIIAELAKVFGRAGPARLR